ncbi:hypothetical protein IAU60_003617 [Kwoniella sp. DSM 27419]
MSRGRVGSVKASAAESEQVTTLWHSLVDVMKLLPSVPTNPSLAKPSHMDDPDYAKNLQTLQKEKRLLDNALEKVEVLIALRRGNSLPPDHNAQGGGPGSAPVSGPAGAGGMGGPGVGIKRKRKLSNGGSASPAPSSLLVPGANAGREDTYPLSPSGGGGGKATPMSREATGKHRREMYYDQLPLQPGRKVAFKLPRQKTNGEEDSGQAAGVNGGGDDWILATIKRCIQQDRMRYEVQDVDDGNAYNTTLRSIIPLPDPSSASHLSSHPSNLHDFPRDSIVLALYPDTTAFYRATVISAPIPGTGHGGGGGGSGKHSAGSRADPGAKKGAYKLMFEEDDHKVHEVQKDLVVAYPF